MFQETESNQQQKLGGETHPSSHTAVLSSNENYAPNQPSGEEAERSMDQYVSHSNQLPSEDLLLETDRIAQGIESYPTAESVHEDNNFAEAQLNSDSNTDQPGIDDDFSSEIVGSKKTLEPAQPLASEQEFQRAEGSIVDDGDFIDYEDVEELEGGASSVSSTLQGDAIDINAVQEHAVPDEPFIAQDQEIRSPRDLEDDTTAYGEILHKYEDEKGTTDVRIPIEEGQINLAGTQTQDSAEKGRSLSGQIHEQEHARVNDQDASNFQNSGSQPEGNARDNQREPFAQYVDDVGSYRHYIFREQGDQAEGDTNQVANASLNGEIGDYSSTSPLQPESSESRTSFRDHELERIDESEAENEHEEAKSSLANHNNDYVSQLQEKVHTRPSFVAGEPAQIQEDDDEITYEDEEYDTDPPHELVNIEQNVAASPGSLKRARSLCEDDNAQEDGLQGKPHFSLDIMVRTHTHTHTHDELKAVNRC